MPCAYHFFIEESALLDLKKKISDRLELFWCGGDARFHPVIDEFVQYFTFDHHSIVES